jgi:hypothetical protein
VHFPAPDRRIEYKSEPAHPLALAPIAPARNANPTTSANPRDSWPEWTDEVRWELGPDSDSDSESDDFRPTPNSEFTPTVEEEAEAVELLNGNGDGDDFDTRTDADFDAMAQDAAAMDAVCSGYAWL